MQDRTSMAMGCSGPTRRDLIVGAAAVLAGATFTPIKAQVPDGISQTAESIHQEPVFQADPKRVFQALTDAALFHKVTLLGEAMRSGMTPGMKSTEISREPGGALVLFGGYITGRQIELVENERIVQAWRAGSWAAGIYSIVRFELAVQGSATRIVFDHTGFPAGQAQHLAAGWKSNYWLPLKKFLST